MDNIRSYVFGWPLKMLSKSYPHKKVRALSWTFVHSMSFMLIGPGLVQDGHSQTKMKSPVNLGCYYRKSKSYLIYIFLIEI